ncbi:MAG: WYL domain-containing protein [Pseudomonadota bacterium]|nr:WYL domain-containing protein [Pseudomonadota bacterium]
MIEGEELRPGDLVRDGDGEQAAQRTRLNALARHLPWVVRRGSGRGVSQSFRWVWPLSETTKPEQVWALAAVRTMLDGLRDAEIGRVLTDLQEEHARRLEGQRPGRDELDRMFFAVMRMLDPTSLDPDNVDRLAKAILERRRVVAGYRHFDGTPDEVEIEPWTLLFADEGVYIYARCLDSRKLDHVDTRRVYNVARFSVLRAHEATFTYPLRAEHDPREIFRHSFTFMLPAPGVEHPQEVVLRFEPSMRAYLHDHRVHGTQSDPEFEADGYVVVRLRLHITYDLVRWVRGHGSTVVVLAPGHLREWVCSGVGGSEGYRRFVMSRGDGTR